MTTTETTSQPGLLATAAEAKAFIFGGNAKFTLVSKVSGKRYTYKIREKEGFDGKPVRFASVMYGSDNEADFTYIGLATEQGVNRTKKSNLEDKDVRVAGLAWTIRQLNAGNLPDSLEVWHEGCCGRCGRSLTVPESIASGFGPECVKKM